MLKNFFFILDIISIDDDGDLLYILKISYNERKKTFFLRIWKIRSSDTFRRWKSVSHLDSHEFFIRFEGVK